RVCPGRHFARDVLFINVASILHVFNILPPADAQGIPVHLEPKMTSGFLSLPHAFNCTINPRSQSAVSLI
ncbi:hypothetical protein CERSUDRAFT_26836, partial [Gelatoporia subvermispora B]